MQPELLMAGETVHRKTNGCAALVTDRLGHAMGDGYKQEILTMHSAWGLQCGQTGMHPCALG